jgi:hypothetical protein
MTKPTDPDQRSAKDTAQLRDEGLKRMLKTAPQPHKDHPKKDESSLKKTKGRG